MKIPFSLNNQEYYLEPYKTSVEKDILLSSSFNVHDLDKVLDLLGFNAEYDSSILSEDEKKVILYKYREISLGDEIEIKFTCDNCGQVNEGILPANDFAKPGKRNDPDIAKLSGEFSEDRMSEYVELSEDEIDDLDIDAYEELKQKIIDNQTTISFIKECSCLICGTKKPFDLGSPKYIVEIMSEDRKSVV